MRIPEESIDIARDVHEVFAFVSDVRNDVFWLTTVVEARLTSDGPIGLGSRFEVMYDAHRHTLDTPPDPSNFQPLVATFTDFVPDRALRGHVESIIQPVAIVRPLLPLFMRANAGRSRYLLENLKRVMDAPTRRPPGHPTAPVRSGGCDARAPARAVTAVTLCSSGARTGVKHAAEEPRIRMQRPVRA